MTSGVVGLDAVPLKIVNGARRVDVDDLMSLAIALRVNPSTLLLPFSTGRDETYDLTGAAGVPAHQVWDWADGKAPLLDPEGDDADLDYQLHARPPGRRKLRWLPSRAGAFADTRDDAGRSLFDRLFPEGTDWSQFPVRELPGGTEGMA